MRRLIIQRSIEGRKTRLADGEEDNFPNGKRTMHTFVTDRKLRNNEEMCERNPDKTFVLSDDDVLGKLPSQAKLDNMVSKCCRAIFTIRKNSLANIFRVHGEGISTFQGAQSGEPALGIDNDPPFGFNMQDSANGYPCVALLPDGKCSYHEEGKPIRCQDFPLEAKHLTVEFGAEIKTCSITFDSEGNQVGVCDGCGAF